MMNHTIVSYIGFINFDGILGRKKKRKETIFDNISGQRKERKSMV